VGASQRTIEERTLAASKRPWWRGAFLGVSLVLVVWIAWHARDELGAAIGAMSSLQLWVLAVALLLEGAAVACLAQVYRTSLEAVGANVSYRQGLQVSMGAFTLSRVLPGGGAAGAVWAAARLRDAGVNGLRAATAVVLEGLLAMATLGVIVTLGAVAAMGRGHVSVGSVLSVFAVAGLLAALGWAAVAALRSQSFRHRALTAAGRVVPPLRSRLDGWRTAVDEIAGTLPPGSRMLSVMGWSSLNWLLDVAALWVVFVGLGFRMEVGVLLVGFGVANLVTALPHTPGGVGLVEAGMTATYVALGAPVHVALAAVLAYRLISFWLPVLAGVPQYVRRTVPAVSTS
jgi:putative heme transporter